MELLVNTSILTAFFAGIAALFAPCCITILLPAYFASIFRQRSKVFLMTFVYFLGLLIVFLPLGLAAATLTIFFSKYHTIIFVLAGIFLLVLGISLILGKQFRLPFRIHPTMKGSSLGSVLVLGIISGIATTCCAPVLAGVITLSALPGSVVLAEIYTLTYVFGMVAPLFIMAALIDRANLMDKLYRLNKTLEFKLLGHRFATKLTNLIVGLAYTILGVIVLVQFRNNPLASHSNFQVDFNIKMTYLMRSINKFTGFVPQWVWAIAFLIIVLLIARIALKSNKEKKDVTRR
ncbi:MAG: cytochrome c biogenesis CcdA family protein [bacterium]|nr:cytochrome c biogenesis CcdA family protein [bacterium]